MTLLASTNQICLLTTVTIPILLLSHLYSCNGQTPNLLQNFNGTKKHLEEFRKCCLHGKSLPWTIELNENSSPPSPKVFCREVLRLDNTTLKDLTNPTKERRCKRLSYKCCLSSHRWKSPRSDELVLHNATERQKRFVDEPEQAVVETAPTREKNCCLCQHRKNTPTGTPPNDTSTCGGFSCCQNRSESSTLKNNSVDSSNEEMANDAPVDEEQVSVEENDEFDFTFVGGLGLDVKTTTTLATTTSAAPIKCQKNFIWDEEQALCIRMLTACPIGMYLDRRTNRCVVGSSQKNQCAEGFRYNQDTEACEDINECIQGLPDGKRACPVQDMQCINIPGSYECICDSGFTMAKDGTCVDINECNHNPCHVGQQCVNVIGSFRCVRHVPCGYGYVLNPKTQQCEDVNECKADPTICGHGMLCVNVRGGHKCVDKQCPGKAKRDKFGNCVPCAPGFEFNITTGMCEDLNECSDGDQCKPWERCVNKRGYFVCEQKINCDHGFRINHDGTGCDDIDECSEKLFNCGPEEICVNLNGSYVCDPSPCHSTQIYDYPTKSCICDKGMRQENEACVDINECEEDPGICPSDQTCLNHVGGYRCFKVTECRPGFERNSTLEPCVDIDECARGLAQCGENMYCVNTIGAYQCICERGYKNLDAKTCVDVNECTLFGSKSMCPDTRARCVNTNGSYMCICTDGYQWVDYPKSRCADIDECARVPPICGEKHRCINLDGGYRCECAEGYQLSVDQKHCEDIDECATYHYKDKEDVCPNSICVNTPGSFKCSCPDGFRLGRGSFCHDIDECNELDDVCASKHGISQACVNLMGAYRCVSNQCPPNYVKSRLGNGFRCQLDTKFGCRPGDTFCFNERPQRIDYLYIELDQETSVPQILARVDTRHLPSGILRADLRQDYANHLRTRSAISAGKAFQLQRSRTQYGSVEVVLTRRLPAPVDILISLHLLSFKGSVQTGNSITKLYLFVTQSATERIRWSKAPKYRHTDFWTQLRYTGKNRWRR